MPIPSAESQREPEEIDRLLERLARLEDLVEDMEQLGIASRTDAEQHLVSLNARLDELTDG